MRRAFTLRLKKKILGIRGVLNFCDIICILHSFIKKISSVFGFLVEFKSRQTCIDFEHIYILAINFGYGGLRLKEKGFLVSVMCGGNHDNGETNTIDRDRIASLDY